MRLLVTGGSGFIGTHVARKATSCGVEWLNMDIRPPVSGESPENWRQVDIMDAERLNAAVHDFNPTHVLHLAARTDTDSEVLSDYAVNTVGSLNVLLASASTPALERFVFTSTQFVLRPGVVALSDIHFDAHTTYGDSKSMGELLTRASMPSSSWVIVRPTNIWGPWHPRYADEFWRVLARGLYLHPSGRKTRRTYGYVGNVAEQMWATLTLTSERVAGRVFYLGDPPMLLKEWTDAFSQALLGRPVRTVPVGVLKAIALGGDAGKRLGLRVPLTSSRLRSMTQDYITPTEGSIAALGASNVSLSEGVRQTVDWLHRGESSTSQARKARR
jgi:nucleoside-diphosphate-sugar epimerase